MGNTSKPTIDPGLYIMTWQNPADDAPGFELINGFGGLEWCVEGAMNLRWITETIAQNRIIRVREQYSFWDGYSELHGSKILTRTCDGKILLELENRNKPVCPKCKVNVLSLHKFCEKCYIITQIPRVKKQNNTPKQSYEEFVKEWLSDA